LEQRIYKPRDKVDQLLETP